MSWFFHPEEEQAQLYRFMTFLHQFESGFRITAVAKRWLSHDLMLSTLLLYLTEFHFHSVKVWEIWCSKWELSLPMLKYLYMGFGWSLYSFISFFPLSSVPTLLVTTAIYFRVELCFCLSCFTIGLGLYFIFFLMVPSDKKVCFLQMILSSDFIHSLHVSLLIPWRIVLFILHIKKRPDVF